MTDTGKPDPAGAPARVGAARPARIRFVLPDGVPAARLPLTLRAAVDGRRVEIRTERLQYDLGLLLRWAHDDGVELAALDARGSSPEGAFAGEPPPPGRPSSRWWPGHWWRTVTSRHRPPSHWSGSWSR